MSLEKWLDTMRPCRRELCREREEMLVLHHEHRDLAERVIRQALKTKAALVGVTIILTVEEIDLLFADNRDDRRR